MLTDILYNSDARLKMKQGVDKLANAVKVTLGAKGRNVAIRNERTGKVKITKDGVTVARVINLPDKWEDMGAQLIKDAAEKTAATAGDGTTTSTILAQVIIDEGMKHLDSSSNPVDIKKGIDKAVEAVVKHLNAQKRDVTLKSKDLVAIATISANNEPEIGKIVTDALIKVGDDGVVALMESKDENTYVEIVDGMQLDKGYISPYFINNFEKMRVEFSNALVLFCERKVSTYHDLENVLNFAIANKKPLLIIAEDVDNEALATLITNRTQKNHPFAAIKHPGFGNMSLQMLEDIAVVCGGKVVSEGKGDVLRTIKLQDYVGQAKKITITNTTTNIAGGKGKKEDIQARITQVKALIENAPNKVEKEKLEKFRLAKLSNGVGAIYVGATTEVEMKEKKDRIEDALCATKAALVEGILPGGGIAYIRAAESVLQHIKTENADEKKGVGIIYKALYAPLNQMLENAGIESPVSISHNVLSEAEDYGYNVKTGKYENFFETGIVDPAKVSREALENAASVGSMFLTTACAIVDTVPLQQK